MRRRKRQGEIGLGNLRAWVELIASFIEALAVTLMVGFIVFGTLRWLFFSNNKLESAYGTYRADLGKGLLVGLELLVAADIIRTVALDLTLANILTLAALVVVRTFLGWTLNLDIEGRWPWQKAPDADSAATEKDEAASPQGSR
jgi:uncharacterized membrane protein